MGTCKYCGKSTKLFSNKHTECEDKHNEGLSVLSHSIKEYFESYISFPTFRTRLDALRSYHFISDEDIINLAQSYLQTLSASLKRQNSASVYQRIKEFINGIGIRYESLNSTRILDTIGEKFVRYHLVSYFATDTPLQKVKQVSERIASEFHLSPDQVEQTHIEVLDKAADNYLRNGFLSDAEQFKVDEYVRNFHIPIYQLPEEYQNTPAEKLAQATVLKDLQRGVIPTYPLPVPVILSKNESALWIFNGVSYLQEKTEKEFVGRHSGFTFKIVKGVYYRIGQSRGKPIEHSYLQEMGWGQLIVTNQNIIFFSPEKSVKIPFKKIIGIVPYTDGFEVQKDGATSKRMVFQGLDCWFIMNLISQLSI